MFCMWVYETCFATCFATEALISGPGYGYMRHIPADTDTMARSIPQTQTLIYGIPIYGYMRHIPMMRRRGLG